MIKLFVGILSIAGSNITITNSQSPKYIYTNRGFCVICQKEVIFSAYSPWFRDHYHCPNCRSIPRERALLYVLSKTYPNYTNLAIHESSPSFRATSLKLKKTASNYSYSYYVEGKKSGEYLEQYNCYCSDKLLIKLRAASIINHLLRSCRSPIHRNHWSRTPRHHRQIHRRNSHFRQDYPGNPERFQSG